MVRSSSASASSPAKRLWSSQAHCASVSAASRTSRSGVRLWSMVTAALPLGQSPEIFVDDTEPFLTDGLGRHLVHDPAVGHNVEPIAEPDRDVDPLLDQQQRGA